jgi:hypothetical protein
MERGDRKDLKEFAQRFLTVEDMTGMVTAEQTTLISSRDET